MPHAVIPDPPSEGILDDLRSGRHGAASEAVSEALRRLRARERRQARRAGIASGGCEPVDGVLDGLEERYRAEPDSDG